MRKQGLIDTLSKKANISKDKSTEVVNTMIDEITEALRRNETVNLVGFGSFAPKTRAARNGKNPRTGETIHIPETRSVGFKAGKQLKEAVSEEEMA